MTGCEARIIGYGEKAIIVVNSESIPSRKRFSAAHELGHWMRDAGTLSLGCNPEALVGSGDANAETRANRYASDLILPQFMFEPRAKECPITFETASSLAAVFQTSLTATSIRLVDYGSYPAMLICSDAQRMRWFWRGAGGAQEPLAADRRANDLRERPTARNIAGGREDIGPGIFRSMVLVRAASQRSRGFAPHQQRVCPHFVVVER